MRRTGALRLVLAGTVSIYIMLRIIQDTIVPLTREESSVNHQCLNHAIDTGIPGFSGGSKILLMTYGRSGSTLTADILRQDPRVFYTSEPLYRLYSKKQNLTIADMDRRTLELVDIFLTCDFQSLQVSDLNNYQLHKSVHSLQLWSCVNEVNVNWGPQEVLDCFFRARQSCISYPVHMVKVIRFRASLARKMLDKHKDLKILYLVRDPRGTLSSQSRVFFLNAKSVANFSEEYCQQLREDLAVVGQLLEEYPQRVLILRYESLAERPLELSEKLYTLLGLRFTSEVRDFLYNATLAGNEPSNRYQTIRRNSLEAAYSWRLRIRLETAQIVDRDCRSSYDTLGYIAVNKAKELWNTTHSLRKSVSFHGRQL